MEDLGEASPISLAEVSEVIKKPLSGKVPGDAEGSGHCWAVLAAVRAVSIFLAGSQTHSQWLLGSASWGEDSIRFGDLSIVFYALCR